MQLEARKYLYDIQQAASLLDEFVTGKTFADYQRDAMLRAAVERKFEIIGEAMTQLAKIDKAVAARSPSTNASFPSATCWDSSNTLTWMTGWSQDEVETNLPTLIREVDARS